MQFFWRALWSGGVAMGSIISATGLAQWIYETVNAESLEIHIQWYIFVIVGLFIILISSLWKAYSLHKTEIAKVKADFEQERQTLVNKMTQLAQFPVTTSTTPISIDVKTKTDNRSMANIYPEIPSDKKSVFFKVGSISAGLMFIENNSVEPVTIEIDYEILNGNVPILLQNRVDVIPFYLQKHLNRSVTLNPKEKTDFGFVVYAQADLLHKGFQFPSYLSSTDSKLKHRVEGRISTFKVARDKVGELPYLDIKLRVIATSAINISKVQDYVFIYRIRANPITSEITLEPIDKEK